MTFDYYLIFINSLISNSAIMIGIKENARLIKPSLTFGREDESNIDEDLLWEGVHAQTPNQIESLSHNMEYKSLCIKRNYRSSSPVFGMQYKWKIEINSKGFNKTSKDWNHSKTRISDSSPYYRTSLKMEIKELLHAMVVKTRQKSITDWELVKLFNIDLKHKLDADFNK